MLSLPYNVRLPHTYVSWEVVSGVGVVQIQTTWQIPYRTLFFDTTRAERYVLEALIGVIEEAKCST